MVMNKPTPLNKFSSKLLRNIRNVKPIYLVLTAVLVVGLISGVAWGYMQNQAKETSQVQEQGDTTPVENEPDTPQTNDVTTPPEPQTSTPKPQSPTAPVTPTKPAPHPFSENCGAEGSKFTVYASVQAGTPAYNDHPVFRDTSNRELYTVPYGDAISSVFCDKDKTVIFREIGRQMYVRFNFQDVSINPL